MPPKRKPVAAKKKTTKKKASKKAPSRKPKESDTIRLVLEADENTIGRFKTIFEWRKSEVEGVTAEEVAMAVFQSGLDHFEKSLDDGANGEDKEEPIAGNLIDLDDEDETFDAEFEAFVSP